ncbi:MAG: GvpL/GvpF family gas vesicle protein [bacterium]
MEKMIYAIIASDSNLNGLNVILKGMHGIMGSTLYTLSHSNISIAVSDFNPSGSPLDKAVALDFAGVIEHLSHSLTLLPVRFGTILESDEMISRLLEQNYNAFVENLKNVEEKSEYGLKVVWDHEKEREKIRIRTEAEEVTAEDYFATSSIHTNYLLEKIKQHRFEDALLKYVEDLVEEITQNLAQINPECKFRKMGSRSIIIDAVFLIDNKKREEFISAVEKLQKTHGDLHFLLSGPWPPYSFTGISIS